MTIDVFSDIACPWCSIGDAHLREALAERPGAEVRWRPFQLQPGLPPEGAPKDAFFLAKFGGRTQMDAAFAHVEQAGRAAGVPFDFSHLSGAPNTADAHRVVLLAEAHGRGPAAARALFDGYFAHGRDIGDAETLVELAVGAGVPEADVRDVLAGDRFRDDVEQSGRLAAEIGVSGVPFLVIDGRVGVSGARPAAVLRSAFEQAEALARATGPGSDNAAARA